MGKLIIDGNSVFEIDEQCLKRRRIPKECEINKYLKEIQSKNVKKRGSIFV